MSQHKPNDKMPEIPKGLLRAMEVVMGILICALFFFSWGTSDGLEWFITIGCVILFVLIFAIIEINGFAFAFTRHTNSLTKGVVIVAFCFYVVIIALSALSTQFNINILPKYLLAPLGISALDIACALIFLESVQKRRTEASTSIKQHSNE